MAGVSTAVQQLLSLAAAPAKLREIATELHIGTAVLGGSGGSSAELTERPWLVRDGFAGLPRAVPEATSAALVRGIRALRERALPASFIYAFDEPWAIGDSLRQRISAVTGSAYALVEDVWAWEIAPGEGGWPPHRGIRHECLDREAPEVINVWVALSDVTADRACMHAVPLDEDPGYPGALDRVDASLSVVRALPVRAGDALFWNANVLHWGGRCAARAAGPRVSCSFTLCRADAAPRFPDLVALGPLAELGLAKRMDLLARMLMVYGHDQADVTDVAREWAAITHGLTTRFSQA
jgi:hypothetical protein